jgi:hypothetical protein
MLGVITPVRNKVAGISQAELSPEPHFALDTACLRLAPPYGVVHLTSPFCEYIHLAI